EAGMRVIEVQPEQKIAPQKPKKHKPRPVPATHATNDGGPAVEQRREIANAAAPAESKPVEPPATHGAQRAQTDAAVRRAARAEQANSLSRYQIWLGATGAILLLGTLAFSVRATSVARRSADVAERALTELEGPHLNLTADSGYSDGRM